MDKSNTILETSEETKKKIELIEKYPTIEILTKEDLARLFETQDHIEHYIGFEISGMVHIGIGLFCGSKIADIQKASVDVKVFMADWHSFVNNKLGGDWENYAIVGKLMAECLKRCAEVFGADRDKIKTVLGSEIYNNDYWRTVLEVSRSITVSRIKRSTIILGRSKEKNLSFAQLLYVPMQVADIFFMGNHIAQGGMDQRKAHVIAREVYNKVHCPIRIGNEIAKPIAIHTDILYSLAMKNIPEKTDDKESLVEEIKMSKSRPNSAIFLDEPIEEIERKIMKGFCPQGEIEYNPVIQLAKLLFRDEKNIVLERDQKYGGDITFGNVNELVQEYAKGTIHPLDLKRLVAERLIELVKPINKWLREGPGKEYSEIIWKNITR